MEAVKEIIFTGDSPFKFLDPYSEEEQEHLFFFGRENEEDELYDFVKKTKVLLLYGISGSGKTSLLQCGLSHKFRMSSGWIPVFIRRGNNINDSLRETLGANLNKILRKNAEEDNEEDDDEWEPEAIETDKDILQSLKLLYGYTLRPAFLVFDQFEEFVLMAEKDEREKFVATLRCLFEARNNPYFNIIILMREKYFGQFDTIMKSIRGIADWRMRLSPLKEDKVVEVIEKLLAYFNIELEDPENDPRRIYNALRNKKGEVSFSNLQIYLDQLWREDYQREYKNGYEGKDFPPLKFSTQEIIDFGTIDVVLQKFLLSQKVYISSLLKQNYPGESDNFLNMVLNEFISEEGNKKPVKFKIKNEYYEFDGVDTEKLNDFNKEALRYTIRLLEKDRIVRIKGNSIELGHDSLARLINDVRDARYKKQIRIRQKLKAIDKGTEEASWEEIYGWTEYIDSSFFTEEEITFYLLLKKEREEEHLNATIKKVVVKAFFVMLGAILAMLLFYRREKVKDKQDVYAVQFIQQLDTVRNGKEAVFLAKYLYDELNDTTYRKTIQDKMLQLATSDNFQRQFLLHSYSLGAAADYGMRRISESFFTKLSDNGSYLLQSIREFNDTTSVTGMGIIVYSSHGVDTLSDAEGYPASNNEILVYKARSKTLNLYSYTNLNNAAATLPWDAGKMGHVKFWPFEPYELGNGEFIIPFKDGQNIFNFLVVDGFCFVNFSKSDNAVRIIRIPPEFKCYDYYYESKLIICAAVDTENDRWILVYDTTGNLIRKIRIGPEEDLTSYYIYNSSNGNMAYTLNGSLFVSADKGFTFKNYRQPPAQPGYSFFLNLEKKCYVTAFDSVVSQYDLSGKLLHSFKLPFQIQSRRYDYKKNQICFENMPDSLSGIQYVYVLDDALKLIAAYPKVSGTDYFLSENGNAIATIRNNSIFVYPLPGDNIAFPDFSALDNWLENQIKNEVRYNSKLEALKKKYHLKRPNFWTVN